MVKQDRNPVWVEIGNRVRVARDAKNWSQERLAQECREQLSRDGVGHPAEHEPRLSRTYVSVVECGEVKLPPRQAGVWAKVLGIPVRNLLSDDDWANDVDRAVALLAGIDATQRTQMLMLLEAMQLNRQ